MTVRIREKVKDQVKVTDITVSFLSCDSVKIVVGVSHTPKANKSNLSLLLAGMGSLWRKAGGASRFTVMSLAVRR